MRFTQATNNKSLKTTTLHLVLIKKKEGIVEKPDTNHSNRIVTTATIDYTTLRDTSGRRYGPTDNDLGTHQLHDVSCQSSPSVSLTWSTTSHTSKLPHSDTRGNSTKLQISRDCGHVENSSGRKEVVNKTDEQG